MQLKQGTESCQPCELRSGSLSQLSLIWGHILVCAYNGGLVRSYKKIKKKKDPEMEKPITARFEKEKKDNKHMLYEADICGNVVCL